VAEQERDDLASVRSELSRLAKRKQDRITEWSRQMPTEWTPGKVVNPEVDMPFTEAGAWDLVARLLDAGHPIQQVSLRQACSAETGYVILVDLKPGMPKLYVKLQLKHGKICGRSFHYSDRDVTPTEPTDRRAR
jgi:hypothetical protein